MNNATIRLVGVFLLIAGSALAYFYAYLPLEAAKNHEENVSISVKLVFLAPVAILVGALAALFGQRGRDWIQSETDGKQRLTIVGWIFTAVCCGAGIAFHQWLESALASYGYQF